MFVFVFFEHRHFIPSRSLHGERHTERCMSREQCDRLPVLIFCIEMYTFKCFPVNEWKAHNSIKEMTFHTKTVLCDSSIGIPVARYCSATASPSPGEIVSVICWCLYVVSEVPPWSATLTVSKWIIVHSEKLLKTGLVLEFLDKAVIYAVLFPLQKNLAGPQTAMPVCTATSQHGTIAKIIARVQHIIAPWLSGILRKGRGITASPLLLEKTMQEMPGSSQKRYQCCSTNCTQCVRVCGEVMLWDMSRNKLLRVCMAGLKIHAQSCN